MEKLISVDIFCSNHQVETSFIGKLQESGLIEIIKIKETAYIDSDQLQKLEKLLRFYYEMEINIEGIEAITYLLQRTETMQNEIIQLKNRLRLYEGDQEF